MRPKDPMRDIEFFSLNWIFARNHFLKKYEASVTTSLPLKKLRFF